jgi:hypothetical protein
MQENTFARDKAFWVGCLRVKYSDIPSLILKLKRGLLGGNVDATDARKLEQWTKEIKKHPLLAEEDIVADAAALLRTLEQMGVKTAEKKKQVRLVYCPIETNRHRH